MKRFAKYVPHGIVALVALVVGLIVGGTAASSSHRTALKNKHDVSADLQLRVVAAEALVRAENSRSQLAAKLVAELSHMFAPLKQPAVPVTPGMSTVKATEIPSLFRRKERSALTKDWLPPHTRHDGTITAIRGNLRNLRHSSF
jgi:hypothetical protein